MLRRAILTLLLFLAACGDQPLEPLVPLVSARAINLSGLSGKIAVWMDGQVIATGLVDTEPSPPLSITPGAHTFGYSPRGAAAPEATTELVVPERGFSLIALMREETGPELRLIAYPAAGAGRITVRALNASSDSARVILRALAAGSELVLDLAPGAFGQIDVSGTHIVRVGFGQQESPTTVELRSGRPADEPRDFTRFEFHDLGFPVSGEVRTLIFHRSPTFAPDLYSF